MQHIKESNTATLKAPEGELLRLVFDLFPDKAISTFPYKGLGRTALYNLFALSVIPAPQKILLQRRFRSWGDDKSFDLAEAMRELDKFHIPLNRRGDIIISGDGARVAAQEGTYNEGGKDDLLFSLLERVEKLEAQVKSLLKG